MPAPPRRILFVCYANACRSQMAEGYARARAPFGVTIESAGLMAAGLHPRSVEAMDAIGIDIRGQTSRTIDAVKLREFDLIVTLSQKAKRILAARAPQVELIHWPILDPVGVRGSEDEIREIFALTRDDICAEIDTLFVERFGEIKS